MRWYFIILVYLNNQDKKNDWDFYRMNVRSTVLSTDNTEVLKTSQDYPSTLAQNTKTMLSIIFVMNNS